MEASKELKRNFRVVIVGGSIAGLTLAHCLLELQIDFVVLESHPEIAPQVGASIGILPNGAHILDQLGVLDDILAVTEPVRGTSYWTEHGRLVAESVTPRIIQERHGYPIAFVDRQEVLRALYENLGQGKEYILTGKRVVKVDNLADGVKVRCTDGSIFEGDLVVGADGVRSTIRRQMWEYMEARGLVKEASEEKDTMVSQYSCVFGISTATPGLHHGDGHRTFGEGWYTASEIPRFDQTEIDRFVQPYLQKPISDTVPFGEVYTRAITRTLLPLEEACYKRWAIDRYVCIGDSAVKMTPNLGQGGNSAIESAASLANSLVSLLHDSGVPNPSTKELDVCLQSWQETRRPRVKGIFKEAHNLTRLEALDTWKDKSMALYLMPYIQGYLTDVMSKTIVGATKINGLPLPVKSLTCSRPFADSEITNEKQLWKRALWTVLFLGVLAASRAFSRYDFALQYSSR